MISRRRPTVDIPRKVISYTMCIGVQLDPYRCQKHRLVGFPIQFIFTTRSGMEEEEQNQLSTFLRVP